MQHIIKIIKDFESWLNEDIKGWAGIVAVVMAGLILAILYNILIPDIMNIFHYELSPSYDMIRIPVGNGIYQISMLPPNVFPIPIPVGIYPDKRFYIFSLIFAGNVFLNAFIEEFWYRFVSIGLMTALAAIATNTIRQSTKIALLISIPVSIFFGYIHGGWDHIFVQGVIGFIFSIVFIKCGGVIKRRNKPVFVNLGYLLIGLLAVAFLHFFNNYFWYVTETLGSGRHFVFY